MLRKISYTIIFSFILCVANAQLSEEAGKYDTIQVAVERMPDGTIIPFSWLETVTVTAKQTPYWKKYWEEWTRLRNAVYVTYPYAKKSALIINEINKQLVNITETKQRKKIIKSREKELRKEFTSKLTKLSVYQGKVLMKLINRQTGNNCYEILKEYKGGFNATAYQTIAFLFGTSLKQPYDANGSDKMMEMIVKDVMKMYGDA